VCVEFLLFSNTFRQLLIASKANINLQTRAGYSPLHNAAYRGYVGCLQELIRAGAEVDAENQNGYTPLADAIYRDRKDCAECLLYAGAKMSNVLKYIGIPNWMRAIVTKRRNAIESTWALLRVMRKRFSVKGQHIGDRLPKDLVKVLGIHLWETRFDERWKKRFQIKGVSIDLLKIHSSVVHHQHRTLREIVISLLSLTTASARTQRCLHSYDWLGRIGILCSI